MILLLLIVTLRFEKSGLPPMAAISGVKMLVTSAVTTAPKAAPMTTATARSTTFPRKRNFLNPCIIGTSRKRRNHSIGLIVNPLGRQTLDYTVLDLQNRLPSERIAPFRQPHS